MSCMRIYSRHTYNVFREEYPRAAQALQSWYQEAEKAKWRTPQDVKEQYSVTASIIPNNRVVFNIMGGEYRLITEVNYKWSTIFIHFFGTHAEYDKVDAATVKLRK
jgi:mRNA interferase HigB